MFSRVAIRTSTGHSVAKGWRGAGLPPLSGSQSPFLLVTPPPRSYLRATEARESVWSAAYLLKSQDGFANLPRPERLLVRQIHLCQLSLTKLPRSKQPLAQKNQRSW